jgi:hypothetical protein
MIQHFRFEEYQQRAAQQWSNVLDKESCAENSVTQTGVTKRG